MILLLVTVLLASESENRLRLIFLDEAFAGWILGETKTSRHAHIHFNS